MIQIKTLKKHGRDSENTHKKLKTRRDKKSHSVCSILIKILKEPLKKPRRPRYYPWVFMTSETMLRLPHSVVKLLGS